MRSLSTLLLVIFFGAVLTVQARGVPAAGADALIQSAPARIEQCRKGDVQISVWDNDGKPIEGVTVQVRQVRHHPDKKMSCQH